jgi:hypothetical protein
VALQPSYIIPKLPLPDAIETAPVLKALARAHRYIAIGHPNRWNSPLPVASLQFVVFRLVDRALPDVEPGQPVGDGSERAFPLQGFQHVV